jgi:hypothetical protein
VRRLFQTIRPTGSPEKAQPHPSAQQQWPFRLFRRPPRIEHERKLQRWRPTGPPTPPVPLPRRFECSSARWIYSVFFFIRRK